MVTGPSFSLLNQPDQEQTTAYRDRSGTESLSDAHYATFGAIGRRHLGGGWSKTIFKTDEMPVSKKLLIALVLTPVAFVLLLVEAVLHGLFFVDLFPDYPALKTRLEKYNYQPIAELVYEDSVPHRTRGIAVYSSRGIPPQFVEFDNDGMRIDSYDGEAKCVVGVFGDSFTSALQVGQFEDYSSITETKLREAGFDVNFRNFGLGRLGTAGEYLRYKQLVDKNYKFDHVILQFYPGNDVVNNSKILNAYEEHVGGFAYFVIRDGQLVREDSRPQSAEVGFFPIREFLAKYSHIANLLHSARYRISAMEREKWQFQGFNPNPEPVWQQAWNVTEAVLEKWVQEARSDSTDLSVVMVTSHPQLTGLIESLGFQRDYPNNRIRKLALEMGVGYLDILPIALNYIKQTNLQPPYFSWETDGHYSQLGHRLVADALTQRMQEQLLHCKQ